MFDRVTYVDSNIIPTQVLQNVIPLFQMIIGVCMYSVKTWCFVLILWSVYTKTLDNMFVSSYQSFGRMRSIAGVKEIRNAGGFIATSIQHVELGVGHAVSRNVDAISQYVYFLSQYFIFFVGSNLIVKFQFSL